VNCGGEKEVVPGGRWRHTDLKDWQGEKRRRIILREKVELGGREGEGWMEKENTKGEILYQ